MSQEETSLDVLWAEARQSCVGRGGLVVNWRILGDVVHVLVQTRGLHVQGFPCVVDHASPMVRVEESLGATLGPRSGLGSGRRDCRSGGCWLSKTAAGGTEGHGGETLCCCCCCCCKRNCRRGVC